MRQVTKGVVLGLVMLLMCGPVVADPVALQLAMRKPSSSLGGLTCQQLFALERKVLRAGGICASQQRPARLVLGIRVRCVSEDERVLPAAARRYLGDVRKQVGVKSCQR